MHISYISENTSVVAIQKEKKKIPLFNKVQIDGTYKQTWGKAVNFNKR